MNPNRTFSPKNLPNPRRRQGRLWLILMLISFLSACAHHRRVIVDTQGTDPQQYQIDLAECRQYVDQVHSKTGAGAVGGAIIGGLVGAILGNHRTARRFAASGAVHGATHGAVATAEERAAVLRHCLMGRGYRVLN